jgi:hypothetical protein
MKVNVIIEETVQDTVTIDVDDEIATDSEKLHKFICDKYKSEDIVLSPGVLVEANYVIDGSNSSWIPIY